MNWVTFKGVIPAFTMGRIIMFTTTFYNKRKPPSVVIAQGRIHIISP